MWLDASWPVGGDGGRALQLVINTLSGAFGREGRLSDAQHSS